MQRMSVSASARRSSGCGVAPMPHLEVLAPSRVAAAMIQKAEQRGGHLVGVAEKAVEIPASKHTADIHVEEAVRHPWDSVVGEQLAKAVASVRTCHELDAGGCVDDNRRAQTSPSARDSASVSAARTATRTGSSSSLRSHAANDAASASSLR